MSHELPIVPGRGLSTRTATELRMGEIYSATRYLNRNHQCTGLEPYINFPTESEIIKEMKSTFVGETVIAAPGVDSVGRLDKIVSYPKCLFLQRGNEYRE